MSNTGIDSMKPHTAVRRTPMRHGKPRIAISTGGTAVSNTGSWRNMRPIHVSNQLAPCSNACPVGVNIPAFIDLLEHEQVREAWHKVLEANPLPGVCGRVCYHPCEFACNRSLVDSVVANHALERYVADQNMRESFPAGWPLPPRSERVAVIGSGPAGLSCAYQLARHGYSVTIYESCAQPGGILRGGIPPYRLPREVLDKEIGDILGLGIRLELRSTLGRDLRWEDLKGCDAVFLATGAHRSRRLEVPGEDAAGVSSALDFLKAVNSGYPPALGRRVIVVGGGNTAIDAARTSLRLGSEVTLLYRRTREEMPAVPGEIDAALQEGVQVHFLAAPVRIRTKDGAVQAVEAQRMQLGAPDASGRRAPRPIPDSHFLLAAEVVLTAIGEEPESDYAAGHVECQGSKIIVTDQQETQTKDIYAGGDAAVSPGGTVANALRSGRLAAESIHRRLSGEPFRPCAERIIEPHFMRSVYFQSTPAVELPAREIRLLVGDFEEIRLGLLETQARYEAARCLRCGLCTYCNNCVIFCPDSSVRFNADENTYNMDLQHCKGCGICMEECPRGCIEMIEEWRV